MLKEVPVGWYHSCRATEITSEEKERWLKFANNCKRETIISSIVKAIGQSYYYHTENDMKEFMTFLEQNAPRRRFRLIKGELIEDIVGMVGAGGGTGGSAGFIQTWNIIVEEYPF